MWMLGPIGFAAPWLLLGLVVLPLLWLILKAVPPAPIRRRFPGVALLLGLTDSETQTDRTPWWLLLLRILAVALVILGFAGPVLNPQAETGGSGPLLVLTDGSWADARDWERRADRIEAALDEAGRLGRPVALVALTDLPPDGGATFQAADAAAARLPALQPEAWAPDADAVTAWAETLEGGFDTLWLSDGLARPWREPLLGALEARGAVTVFESPRPVRALRPARFEEGEVRLTALRAVTGSAAEADVAAIGLDPAGAERQLARETVAWDSGEDAAEVAFDLPPELRNRITRFELSGIRSAGAVTLADDALQRREVALIAGGAEPEGLELLDPLHYLREALEPTADVLEGDLNDLLLANPDVLVFADVATLADTEAVAVREWVEAGGMLLRFAGPRLAASDVSRTEESPLLPVRLRAGGRSIGGAMSWGEPKTLAPFAEDSPFFGLPLPDDVVVNAQVMAQPDPSLAARVIAQLADGTPLVTRKPLGDGQVVLFHVTANAEWSSLPLSGLFVDMLERLAVSTRPPQLTEAELAGTTWAPEEVLTAFGRIEEADTLPGVTGERLAAGGPGPDMPPGLYAGDDRRIAVNVLDAEATLAPMEWPARVPVVGLEVLRETVLKGWVLAAALALLLADVLASLALSGRLRGPRAAPAALALTLALAAAPDAPRAQDAPPPDPAADALALEATQEVVLAHVLTGNRQVDDTAEAGLRGLSDVLYRRTSIEPAAPLGVDLETDELAFFPLLYWPVTEDQPIPSADAYARLNRYLRSGGMILFDTRDADLAGFGSSSPEGRKLQALARGLDIPPLEPLPADHVLTRTFYLLQDFPGRHAGREIWVEAAPPGAEQVEGMPFRDLNDGVTPVVIGGNDWAAAWATDEAGNRLFPVGRGMTGERQREMAYRFGVNLVMHVLTGNYKSDQVHVPALLDRLGQ
ncbi:hypothetical protein OG2516_16901 [Oceanicola granulosus HTCC2516]|uniref:LytTR family transcriptional regulator n=1 Tax=Oceanicola granulosus (strain ATCC BAA-861 / DSM 15982 / KCTC 12143 / HTCC2516) TaxID=314256 RepID=Q2CFR3_OCEGH|nr:DUF4159 domain-containing protein [Oceanicola granulosus]EAR51419.1 hypothetical protein OG2516_16901 [Oceanicola granulosus HTCC2516]